MKKGSERKKAGGRTYLGGRRLLRNCTPSLSSFRVLGWILHIISAKVSIRHGLVWKKKQGDAPPINQTPASLAISLIATTVSPSSWSPELPTSGTFSAYSLNLATAYGEFQISGKTIKSGGGFVDLSAAWMAARATAMLLDLEEVREDNWRRASLNGLAWIWAIVGTSLVLEVVGK